MRCKKNFDPIILNDLRNEKYHPSIDVGILLPETETKPIVKIIGDKIYNMTRRKWFSRYNTILVPIEINPPVPNTCNLTDKCWKPTKYGICTLNIPLKSAGELSIVNYKENTKNLNRNQVKINIIIYPDNDFDPSDSDTKDSLERIYKYVNIYKYDTEADFSFCEDPIITPPKKVGNSIIIG